VGTTVYALVNISNTATPNYQLHSSTDGTGFTAIGATFASGNSSINRLIHFDNKFIVSSSNTSAIPNPIFVSTDTGANCNCRNIRTSDGTSISFGQGSIVNIGNRAIGYSLSSTNFDKGVYVDLE
jgi:hypothetical protein